MKGEKVSDREREREREREKPIHALHGRVCTATCFCSTQNFLTAVVVFSFACFTCCTVASNLTVPHTFYQCLVVTMEV